MPVHKGVGCRRQGLRVATPASTAASFAASLQPLRWPSGLGPRCGAIDTAASQTDSPWRIGSLHPSPDAPSELDITCVERATRAVVSRMRGRSVGSRIKRESTAGGSQRTCTRCDGPKVMPYDQLDRTTCGRGAHKHWGGGVNVARHEVKIIFPEAQASKQGQGVAVATRSKQERGAGRQRGGGRASGKAVPSRARLGAPLQGPRRPKAATA